MLTPPEIPDEAIAAVLRDRYALRVTQSAFLPIGADERSAVYRVVASEGTPYFLKLRRGFQEVAVAVPAHLHAMGVRQVLPPVPTTTRELWAFAHGFAWILYPYLDCRDANDVGLSRGQWVELGQAFRAIHATTLPDDLVRLVPREAYSARWRDSVRAFDREAERNHDDPTTARLAAFWLERRGDIRRIVDRAELLAERLRAAQPERVLCHADLHGWNVLVGADGSLAIVDWDEVILAPKERDLMSVGGGLFGDWNPDRESDWFYEGYGPTEADPIALAYYRYERIVADFAAYAEQIVGRRGGVEDRENGVRQLASQFLPGGVVEKADRTFQSLA